MDVKYAFFNDILNNDAHVKQSEGFKDAHFSNYIFKLKKVLYGLKQAPRAWYKRLTKFLLENGYEKGV